MSKWFITLPPSGAARYCGMEIINVFTSELGAENVKTFDYLKYQEAFGQWLKEPEPDRVADLSNQSMFIQCVDFAPTHILALPLSPVTLFILNLLKRQNIKTVHWFYEDFREADYWRSVVGGYDYFFAIQRGAIPQACQMSGACYRYLPQAVPQSVKAPSETEPRDVDLVFVGIPSPYRIQILEYLAEKGITMLIAGLNWHTYKGPLEKYLFSHDWVNMAQTPVLYERGAIALNLSYSDPANDRENTHLSPRVFDILKAGRILVTEKAPLAQETLEGLAYLTFETVDELYALLISPENSISKESLLRNQSVVNQKHTYLNRVQSMLEWTV